MNLEQVEGQLAEFEGHDVSVAIPIRGTVCQVFFGKLEIVHDWAQHIILYQLGFYPDAVISFQAQDVQCIVTVPATTNNGLLAKITLKPDTFMEQSRLDHV